MEKDFTRTSSSSLFKFHLNFNTISPYRERVKKHKYSFRMTYPSRIHDLNRLSRFKYLKVIECFSKNLQTRGDKVLQKVQNCARIIISKNILDTMPREIKYYSSLRYRAINDLKSFIQFKYNKKYSIVSFFIQNWAKDIPDIFQVGKGTYIRRIVQTLGSSNVPKFLKFNIAFINYLEEFLKNFQEVITLPCVSGIQINFKENYGFLAENLDLSFMKKYPSVLAKVVAIRPQQPAQYDHTFLNYTLTIPALFPNFKRLENLKNSGEYIKLPELEVFQSLSELTLILELPNNFNGKLLERFVLPPSLKVLALEWQSSLTYKQINKHKEAYNKFLEAWHERMFDNLTLTFPGLENTETANSILLDILSCLSGAISLFIKAIPQSMFTAEQKKYQVYIVDIALQFSSWEIKPISLVIFSPQISFDSSKIKVEEGLSCLERLELYGEIRNRKNMSKWLSLLNSKKYFSFYLNSSASKDLNDCKDLGLLLDGLPQHFNSRLSLKGLVISPHALIKLIEKAKRFLNLQLNLKMNGGFLFAMCTLEVRAKLTQFPKFNLTIYTGDGNSLEELLHFEK